MGLHSYESVVAHSKANVTLVEGDDDYWPARQVYDVHLYYDKTRGHYRISCRQPNAKDDYIDRAIKYPFELYSPDPTVRTWNISFKRVYRFKFQSEKEAEEFSNQVNRVLHDGGAPTSQTTRNSDYSSITSENEGKQKRDFIDNDKERNSSTWRRFNNFNDGHRSEQIDPTLTNMGTRDYSNNKWKIEDMNGGLDDNMAARKPQSSANSIFHNSVKETEFHRMDYTLTGMEYGDYSNIPWKPTNFQEETHNHLATHEFGKIKKHMSKVPPFSPFQEIVSNNVKMDDEVSLTGLAHATRL